jgi:hypothetical protein
MGFRDIVGTVVNSRVWVAATHLSLAAQIVTIAASLLTGSGVTALLAILTPVPNWLLALILAALVLLIYGLIALRWERRLTQTPQSPVREWGIHGEVPKAAPSADLAAFRLSTRDLDRAARLALAKARAELGPDAVVEFHEITVLPKVTVRFRSWSRIGDRNAHLMVTGDTVTVWGVRAGAMWTTGENMDQPVWDHDRGPFPWKVEKGWEEVVRQAWYRVRPFEGNAVLKGDYPTADPDWGLWWVCFEPTDRFGAARPSHKRCFGMHHGQLEEFGS